MEGWEEGGGGVGANMLYRMDDIEKTKNSIASFGIHPIQYTFRKIICEIFQVGFSILRI